MTKGRPGTCPAQGWLRAGGHGGLRFGLAAPGLGSSNAGSGEGAIKPWGPALAKGSTSGSPCSPKTEAHQHVEVPRAVQPPWPPSLPGCLEGRVHPRKAGWPGSQEAAQGDPRELVRWEVVECYLVVWNDSCQGKEARVGMEPLKTLRWRGWYFYNVLSLVSTGAAKRVWF